MANLARAIEIASGAHVKQTRKDGSPYILHPLRLLFKVIARPERFESEDAFEAAKIAAVMHDVIEDTAWSREDLKQEGFNALVLETLNLLTHDDGSAYDDYVRRIGEHPVARQVKLADLEDNMNLMELPEVGDKQLKRCEKYHRNWLYLSSL